MRRQRLAVEVRQIDLARGGLGRRDIVERQAMAEQRMRDGAVGQAGVEMRQVVIVGKPARQRAFAGGRGTVDGDGECERVMIEASSEKRGERQEVDQPGCRDRRSQSS